MAATENKLIVQGESRVLRVLRDECAKERPDSLAITKLARQVDIKAEVNRAFATHLLRGEAFSLLYRLLSLMDDPAAPATLIAQVQQEYDAACKKLIAAEQQGPLAFRRMPQETAVDALYLLLFNVTEYFHTSKTMTGAQLEEQAYLIIDKFPDLTLEDVLVCFRNAKAGEYGEVYNRIDGQVIQSWLRKHQEYRRNLFAALMEKRHYQLKHQQAEPVQMPDEVKAEIAAMMARWDAEKPKEEPPPVVNAGALRYIDPKEAELLKGA